MGGMSRIEIRRHIVTWICGCVDIYRNALPKAKLTVLRMSARCRLNEAPQQKAKT